MSEHDVFQTARSHHQAGRLTEAIGLYSSILVQNPHHVGALNQLARLAAAGNRPAAALELLRRAVAAAPDDVESRQNLGDVLEQLGHDEDAIEAFRDAARLRPSAATYARLGALLIKHHKLDDAALVMEKAFALEPNNPAALKDLGLVYARLGRIKKAVACYRQACSLDPGDFNAGANFNFFRNYLPDASPESVVEEHRKWADRHGGRWSDLTVRYTNDRSPDRQLRIGYVSGDFRRHSVGYFFLPLLNQHDRDRFQIFCYGNVQRPDIFTRGIEGFCDGYRNIFDADDDAVAQTIRDDRIDVLVDLSGHSAHNRLLVFFRKPAPIQVTYLGYPCTTGISAIDYRLTDSLADPIGVTDRFNVEKLWRLPTCAWCYQPGANAPDILSDRAGPITFGCCNAIQKLNYPLIKLWALLLHAVPDSRLLLKCAGLTHVSARQRVLAGFAEQGICANRLDLRRWADDPLDHLGTYNEIDIALDTFPYHGTTTTCEALWMGVPVVTLAGQTHASRVGVSLLTNAMLTSWIAQSSEEVVSIAVHLARNREFLRHEKVTLRGRLRQSPLMDACRFTRDVETEFRNMWRSWCAGGKMADEKNV